MKITLDSNGELVADITRIYLWVATEKWGDTPPESGAKISFGCDDSMSIYLTPENAKKLRDALALHLEVRDDHEDAQMNIDSIELTPPPA